MNFTADRPVLATTTASAWRTMMHEGVAMPVAATVMVGGPSAVEQAPVAGEAPSAASRRSTHLDAGKAVSELAICQNSVSVSPSPVRKYMTPFGHKGQEERGSTHRRNR